MLKKLVFLFLLFSLFLGKAQINNGLKSELQKILTEPEKKILATADKHYKNQEYIASLGLYDSLSKAYPGNLYLKYLLGTCQCYNTFYFSKAEENIKAAEPIKNKLPDYDFYLGKVYENNDKYEDAIKQFEIYMQNQLPDTLKSIVKYQIEICKSSLEQLNKGTIASITNIGPPVNSAASEYGPILPGNENFIVFAYLGPKSKGGKQKLPGKADPKGAYFEDVFLAQKKDTGGWDEPQPINTINTTGNDAPLFISHDGQKLYIFRNVALGSGDIFVSYLKGTEWSIPERLKGINSSYWEGSICFSPDEKTVYFSSERPGGQGGRDIWFGQLMPDGIYGNIKNLGATINSTFDEDAPFVTADGKTMFFSSTGHNSTGGYDIFRTDMKNGKWGTPYNIGKPVNSNQDDKYYWVSADGQRAYYSTERKGGLGLQDIYLVEPGMFGKPTALVVLKGIVYVDDKPVEAAIKIKSKYGRKSFSGYFTSNSASGKYLVNIPSGNEFEVEFFYKDLSLIKSISTVTLDSFASLTSDVNLYSKEYLKKITVDSSQVKSDVAMLNMNYDEFLAKYGDLVADSVTFKVQIGAYQFIENFNFNKLLQLPAVRRQAYADGITRFTLGEFQTLKQADGMCKQAKKIAIKDAFVIAFYKNKRLPLDELIKGNYFKK
ncbi:MAG TPA: hypothetical protein VK835_05850 [Bacteroidia bacterium]|jgi:hypothetical protein|nr:hypothetical protein [Bacteroidia bacterium]